LPFSQWSVKTAGGTPRRRGATRKTSSTAQPRQGRGLAATSMRTTALLSTAWAQLVFDEFPFLIRGYGEINIHFFCKIRSPPPGASRPSRGRRAALNAATQRGHGSGGAAAPRCWYRHCPDHCLDIHTGPAYDFFCKWPAAKKKDLAKRTASPAA
jgi:hypothetical protein